MAGFDAWLEQTLRPVAVSSEVPLLVLDDAGSVVSGMVDMLVETADGFWIIDYKSDCTDDLNGRFACYLPQLRCYADSVARARGDKPVLGLVVNWVSYGMISILDIG